MKKGRVFDLAILTTSLAAFSFFALRQLDLPGLYYDEAADAVPAMQLVLGQKLELLNQAGLAWGNLTLPIMIMDYVGTVNTYLLVPLFSMFGVSVISLRLLTILGGLLTIVFSYFVARALFDRTIAAATVILLAVHPSFVFWSRQGIHVTSIMTVLSTASLLCLIVWRRSGRQRFLYLAAFLLGLGLSAKLLFLWFIVALAATTFVLFGIPKMARHLRIWGKRDVTADNRNHFPFSPFPLFPLLRLAGCILSFVLGAWMILLYNLLTSGTITVLTKNLVTTGYGVNNFAFWTNLLTSLDGFRVFLQGENFWYLGGLFANDWYPTAFVVSAIGSLVVLIHPLARRHWRSLLFPPAIIAIIVIQSCFTVSGLWPTHDYITYPFPQMTLAAFALTTIRLLPLKKLAPALLIAALLLMVARDSYVNQEYHRVLAKTGGLFTHSDAIYRLSTYLDSRGVAEPMAMDWGIKSSVQILTMGRINPIEIFQYDQDPGPLFFDWLYGALTTRPDTLYIFHADDNEIFPRYQAFESLARKLDKKVTLEQTVLQKDRSPIYTVYSAR
ncbi:MAG: glycosyltransferase family 39 protein [Dehalococcoidia bacterium]|nr:glycosyltransferase family 39 protein [Dehalococcoidia bacterium]